MKELRKITPGELEMILKNHERWLDTDGKEGERADLSYADLEGANLTGADLAFANLRHAYLSDACLLDANLECANLECANLRYVNLSRADLCRANLRRADLAFANLRHAYLSDADLRGANLAYANLEDANLEDADLSGANLSGANLTNVKNFPDIPMACPTEGSFIGWKHAGGYVVELEIPEDAKRSSGNNKMCRCNKAKVLAIENRDGSPTDVTEVCSDYDPNFIYRVGETVTVDDFDDNRFNECAPGIHFCMNRDSVVSY